MPLAVRRRNGICMLHTSKSRFLYRNPLTAATISAAACAGAKLQHVSAPPMKLASRAHYS
eukprot:4930880-Pleurochrysis_carterae.AAC.1